MEDTIVIREEGRLPQCDSCGIFQRDVGQKHKESIDCKRATKAKEAHKDAKLQMAAKEIIFNVKGIPIENVKSFKYLGRTLEENDDDWPAL